MAKNLSSFAKRYKKKLFSDLESIPFSYFNKVANILLDTQRQKKHIFVIGNGSSAALAQHMAVDFNKGVRGGSGGLFKVIPLTDNTPTLTAWANDVSYEYIFTGQLENLYRKGDILVCISGSGDSPNIIQAAKYVKEHGGKVIALPCFAGEELKPFTDCFLRIPDRHHGRIEDIQQITLHMISFFLGRG